MVMEYWTGWFDHWAKEHSHRSTQDFSDNLKAILTYSESTSVNMYMFFGGTNFGFMNGANSENEEPNNPVGYEYVSDTTSYDYDAPLSEAGHMTDKFYAARKVIAEATGRSEPSLEGLFNATVTAYPDPELVGY